VQSVKIACINPLDGADEIKDLFLTHDRPEFPEFFDRAYPSAVQSGGKSWIGVERDGRLVMHISRFPHRFLLGQQTVVAGLLANLMVAKSHRAFLPAVALVRQVIADSKAAGDADFLYADPNAPGTLVLNAAGFSTLGAFERFAFPIAGRRWYTDALVRVYHAIAHARAWKHSVEAVEHDAQHFDAKAFERPAGSASALRPFRVPELYRQRLAGYPSETDYWFTIHQKPRSNQPCAAILVRGFAHRIAKLISLSREPSLPLRAIVPTLADRLRRRGYERLWVSTLGGTEFARELTRVGFIRRHDSSPMLAYALTELGTRAIRSVTTWEITDLDCDRG
jgi:hypothetical protein